VEESPSSSPEIKSAFNLCTLIYTDAYESVEDTMPLSRPRPSDDTPGTESMDLNQELAMASTTSKGNIMELVYISDRLPIWKWWNNSCSLDGSLIIVLCFILHCLKTTSNWVDMYEQSNPCFDVLRKYVASWSKDNAQWVNWDEGALTEARDAIRAIIESYGSSIGINSSADDLILKLMPSPQIQTDLAFDITCMRCRKNFVCLGKYLVLMFDGFAQENSNSQALIDHMVRVIIFRVLTCGRERHYIDILHLGPVSPAPIARSGLGPDLMPTRPGSLHIPSCCSCRQYTQIAPLDRAPRSIERPKTSISI
jgi:hypothetical protein